MWIRRSATNFSLAGVLLALFVTLGWGDGTPVAQGHGRGHSPEALPPPQPEPASAVAPSGGPAATLRADSVDAPAPTAVAEAERSAALAAEMAMGGHGLQHGSYVQTDAGREPRPDTPAADPHHMHGAPAAPPPKPTPSPTPTPWLRTEEHR